jgi:Transposase zinc-binding domain
MVSCRGPARVQRPATSSVVESHSPFEITLHNTRNGAHSITCRNRHCPKCQANARDRWLEARGKELLPTRYVHVVFTLPRHLSPLALQNKREIYALLFRASAETLLEISRRSEAPRRGDWIL